MGRVINLEAAGKERTRLVKTTVLALRELMKQNEANDHTKDLAAYVALSLIAISESIDPSVAAWEKRGYWVKADRFRLEWVWTARLGQAMRAAVLAEDWPAAAATAAQVGQKLNHTDVPAKNRLGAPWEGAWQRLQAGADGGA